MSFRFARIAFWLLAAYLAVPGTLRAIPIEGIAAIVGDDVILVSEVQERAAPALAQAMRGESAFIREQQIREAMLSYLERMISQTLIEQEATRLMMTATDDEVSRAVEGIKAQNGWDDFQLESQLAERGQTLDQFREETRVDVLKFKVLSARLRGRVRPSEEDLLRAYRQSVREMRSGDAVEVAQILVRVPRGASAIEVQRLEERAQAIARRAGGGEDFAQLAREYSDDASTAANGGSIGIVRRGELHAALDEEIVTLEIGDVAGPVRGPEGYYVLKLVSGTVTGVRPFEQVRRNIEGRLLQEIMTRQEEVFLQNLRRETFIDVRLH